MIDDYFIEFSKIISHLDIITYHSVTKKKIDDYSGVIRGKIYIDNYCLKFLEVIFLFNNPQKQKKKYSYHFMDGNNALVFRYDNAYHHREIKSFPHHKHLTDRVIETTEPDIKSVIKEIRKYLNK